MSVRIPSDLVLDVARAADPARMSKAMADLGSVQGSQDIASAAVGSSSSFGSLLPPRDTTRVSGINNTPMTPENKASLELETLLLQQMMESMMPKGDSPVFGGGMAGSVWKSMLAEHVARNIASSGALDLSRVLRKKSA